MFKEVKLANCELLLGAYMYNYRNFICMVHAHVISDIDLVSWLQPSVAISFSYHCILSMKTFSAYIANVVTVCWGFNGDFTTQDSTK